MCDWILRAIISTGITGELAVDDEVVTPIGASGDMLVQIDVSASNTAFLEVDLILGLSTLILQMPVPPPW